MDNVTPPVPSEVTPTPPPRRRSLRRRLTTLVVGLLLVWAALAYLVLPAAWKRYAHRHPLLTAEG
jgi:hypothetical protein